MAAICGCMIPDASDQETIEDFRTEYDGWEDRVDTPERYHGWEAQAAHLRCKYNVPEKRACVVALKQEGAPGTVISDILDVTESTVSGHFTDFKTALSRQEDLRDIMGPHPWDDYDSYDPNMWLPLARVSFEYNEIAGSRSLKLFVDRVGNAVESEFLLVDRKTMPTEIRGEVTTTKTRSAMSGTETVISKLTRGFRRDKDTVAHLILLYNGHFDPRGGPEHYTSMRQDRIQSIAETINGDTSLLLETLDID